MFVSYWSRKKMRFYNFKFSGLTCQIRDKHQGRRMQVRTHNPQTRSHLLWNLRQVEGEVNVTCEFEGSEGCCRVTVKHSDTRTSGIKSSRWAVSILGFAAFYAVFTRARHIYLG